jgi:hypothetical protein
VKPNDIVSSSPQRGDDIPIIQIKETAIRRPPGGTSEEFVVIAVEEVVTPSNLATSEPAVRVGPDTGIRGVNNREIQLWVLCDRAVEWDLITDWVGGDGS